MLILAASLALFVYGVITALLGTLMPTFKLSDAQNGTIALALAIGLVIASVSVGPLIDRRGKKVALLIGLGMIALALFRLPDAAGKYHLLMAFFLVLGLGGGIVVTAANGLASDVSETRRASVLNILNLFFGLGGFATPFIMAHLLGGDPVRLCYLAAVLTVVALAVNAAAKMPAPVAAAGGATESGAVYSRPVLYLVALFLFLYVACEVGVWNWLNKYLVGRGLPADTALNIVSFGFALGLIFGRLVISRVLINVSALNVTLASAVLMAATTFLMLRSDDPTLAWIAVFCAGLAMAPVFPTALAIVGDVFRSRTNTAMGFAITCGWLGYAVSSPIIGFISSRSSLGAALLILPVFSVAMVVVNLAIRPLARVR
ncbi:MAG TPA: MFS transporter [Bryobacteraceae bacterium]|nr:MFS transporter [Bryobacteraceae bacterium]